MRASPSTYAVTRECEWCKLRFLYESCTICRKLQQITNSWSPRYKFMMLRKNCKLHSSPISTLFSRFTPSAESGCTKVASRSLTLKIPKKKTHGRSKVKRSPVPCTKVKAQTPAPRTRRRSGAGARWWCGACQKVQKEQPKRMSYHSLLYHMRDVTGGRRKTHLA